MLAMLLDHLEHTKQAISISTIRSMFTCGEALDLKLCKRFEKLSMSRLVNLYGPTEADMTWWEYPRNNNKLIKVPIGKPMTNVRVYILDDKLMPVPVGVPGELCFGGVATARGYINRPELTSKCFVKNPYYGGRMYRTGDLVQWMSDGNIEFLGRIDFQIKLRGYRIELAEIESVLMSKCDGVKAALVMLRGDNPEEHYLAAYLQPGKLDLESVTKQCKEHLPQYMVPTRMNAMETYPLNERNKVDRTRLPEIPIVNQTVSDIECTANTETEKEVERIWKEVLKYDSHLKIDMDSDFEHLGGSSLLAGYAITKLRLAFNKLTISGTSMYTHSTIRKFGKYIDDLRVKEKLADVSSDLNFKRASTNGYKKWKGKSPTSCLSFIWHFIFVGFHMLFFLSNNFFYYLLAQLINELPETGDYFDRILTSGKLGLTMVPAVMVIEILEILVLVLFSLFLKWILIGHIKEGRHSVFGSFYWKWLITKFITQEATDKLLDYFGGTRLFNVWIRCLGGTVGSRTEIDSAILTPELVSIGSDTLINGHSHIDPCTVENGELIFQRIKIGNRCQIKPTAYVVPGTNLSDDQIVGPLSSTDINIKSANVKPNLTRRLLRSKKEICMCLGVPLLLLMKALPIFILSLVSANLHYLLKTLIGLQFPQLSEYLFILLLPHVSWFTYTEVFFSIVVIIKKLLIGPFEPGLRSRSAWNDFRYWIMGRINRSGLFQQAMRPWRGSELLSIKYRLLGVKIGSRVDIDFIEMIEHDLLTVGNGCVFASRVKLFASDEQEVIPITIADNGNVLDHTVLMPGVKVGKEAICGGSTIGPKNHKFPDFSVSTGNKNGEPILLRRRFGDIAGKNSGLPEEERQMVVLARSRHKSTLSWLLYNVWVVLCVAIWMPMANFCYLSVILFWHFAPFSLFWSVMITPILWYVCDLVHVCLVVAVKWMVIGSYKKGKYPYYGLLHYKWTLMMLVHDSLDAFLVSIEGTFLMNLFHRAMGASVGKNVCILGKYFYAGLAAQLYAFY